MPNRVTTEEDLRRYARRLVEGEAWLLALCVEIVGWTPENELRLAQVWLAARSTYSVSLTL